MVEQEFKMFVESIVNSEFPEERVSFRLTGDRILQKGLLTLKTETATDEDREYFFALPDVTADAIEWVKLATATLGLISVFKKKPQFQLPLVALQEKWQNEMVRKGIKKDKAETIAAAFVADLNLLISKA
jgi:hypothetical protein